MRKHYQEMFRSKFSDTFVRKRDKCLYKLNESETFKSGGKQIDSTIHVFSFLLSLVKNEIELRDLL